MGLQLINFISLSWKTHYPSQGMIGLAIVIAASISFYRFWWKKQSKIEEDNGKKKKGCASQNQAAADNKSSPPVVANGGVELDSTPIAGRLRTAITQQESQQEEEEVKPIEVDEKEKTQGPECKDVEVADWLLQFAWIIRSCFGIEPDYHTELFELGMNLCLEACTVTKEEAETLFDKGASMLQEAAALALINLGNVHMCAARKRMAIDDQVGPKETTDDWVREKYTVAEKHLEEALLIKPGFHKGLVALGQLRFELACEKMADDPSKQVLLDEASKKKKKQQQGEVGQMKVTLEVAYDWLFELAQIFLTHVGIDPINSQHIDLREVGMEQCSKALEETLTSEEAQTLFDKAASSFQGVAAVALWNWGNVHICLARKGLPCVEAGPKEKMEKAYDWAREKFTVAMNKYEEALLIKPDFYLGLFSQGKQQLEMAKLNWSFVLAKKTDLSQWDSAETFGLFDSAVKKLRAATEMCAKVEKQRAPEGLKRKKAGGEVWITSEDAQAVAMKSEVHLLWGEILFLRSKIECKLGMSGWQRNYEDALQILSGASVSKND